MRRACNKNNNGIDIWPTNVSKGKIDVAFFALSKIAAKQRLSVSYILVHVTFITYFKGDIFTSRDRNHKLIFELNFDLAI